MKHFKQDLAEVERLRRGKRDPEQTFHPSVNVFDPLRRSDGAAHDAEGAEIATRAQPIAVTRGRAAYGRG
jgi:hypothetical protein